MRVLTCMIMVRDNECRRLIAVGHKKANVCCEQRYKLTLDSDANGKITSRGRRRVVCQSVQPRKQTASITDSLHLIFVLETAPSWCCDDNSSNRRLIWATISSTGSGSWYMSNVFEMWSGTRAVTSHFQTSRFTLRWVFLASDKFIYINVTIQRNCNFKFL